MGEHQAPRHLVLPGVGVLGLLRARGALPPHHVAAESLCGKDALELLVAEVGDELSDTRGSEGRYQVPTYSARCWPVSVERAATSARGVPSKTIFPPS